MTAPTPFLSTTFVNGEKIDNTKLYARVLSWCNQLLANVLNLGTGFIGEASATTGGPTLAAPFTDYATAGHVTFTLATARRVRVLVQAYFLPATATTTAYVCQATYIAGGSATVAGSTKIGFAAILAANVAGATGSGTATSEGTVLLAAGTYTAFGSVRISTGGNASDTVPSSYIGVYDIGAV